MKPQGLFAAGLMVSVLASGAGMYSIAQAQQADMTFFATSIGKGKGADLGGLDGADAHCAALAKAAGATRTNWRAYLSTTAPGGDTTCANWTSSGEGSAIVGHHDRHGLKDTRHMTSWNSSHGTRGCSQEGLKSTGGAGLFYCFAAD